MRIVWYVGWREEAEGEISGDGLRQDTGDLGSSLASKAQPKDQLERETGGIRRIKDARNCHDRSTT